MKYKVIQKSANINNQVVIYDEYSIDVLIGNKAHTIIFKGYDKTSKSLLSNNSNNATIILKPKVNQRTGVVSTRAYALIDFGTSTQEIELKMTASDIFILELVFDAESKK